MARHVAQLLSETATAATIVYRSSVAGHHPHFWFASDDTMRCIARAVWPEHPWEEAQPEPDGLKGRVRSADFASGLTLPGDSRSDEEMGSPSRSGTAV